MREIPTAKTATNELESRAGGWREREREREASDFCRCPSQLGSIPKASSIDPLPPSHPNAFTSWAPYSSADGERPCQIDLVVK